MATDTAYLKTLLTSAGQPKPLAQAKVAKGQKSILADLGGRSTEGFVGAQLAWDLPAAQTGDYSMSLRNQLRESVKNVYCLVVFYDSQGSPIDVDVVQYPGIILAGLAKRVTGKVVKWTPVFRN